MAARPYRPEGLRRIACEIVVNDYRDRGISRFTSDDLLRDLRAHPDFATLAAHNPRLLDRGVYGVVVGPVTRSMRFVGQGPFAGQLALRFVRVPGRKLHDLWFADEMGADEWEMVVQGRQKRLHNAQMLLEVVEEIVRALRQRGPTATLAMIHGRMAVGF